MCTVWYAVRMALTLRHHVGRAVLRSVFLPVSRFVRPLAWQRTLLEGSTRTVRMPKSVSVTDVELGGRPARHLVPQHKRTDGHVLYLHGGAYVAGSLRSHTPIAALVAEAVGAQTWLVDYRLAPEHPYPAAREDALTAYNDLLDQGVSGSDIILAGDSAGGGLALSTALAIRQAGWPAPAGLVLLSPWTDVSLSSSSYQRNKAVEVMLSARFLWVSGGRYCGEEGGGRRISRADPGVSPIFADFAGLPPILAHVGGDEILLDDSRLVVERARAAGVAATLRVFDGLWHVFHAGAGTIPEADEALREVGEFARAQLARAQPGA